MNCKKRTLRKAASALFALVIGAAVTHPALAGSYDDNDFLVANISSNNVAIYDENLVFKSYLDSNFRLVIGIDLLPNGSAVIAGENGECRTYNPSGVLQSTFTDVLLDRSVIDVKVTSDRIYAALATGAPGVQEFDLVGNRLRNFGSMTYPYSAVVLPGSVLWSGILSSPIINRFDLATGNTLSGFTLDNAQGDCISMRYSASTGTVLMAGTGADSFFERTTSGAFVRQFAAPNVQDTYSYGITRGPGGKVYATDYRNDAIYIWQANGTFVSSTATAPVGSGPCNIIWTGSLNNNQLPVASPQSLTVNANTPKGITLVASDADNNNLTFTIVSGPSHGTLSGGFGNFRTYTPAANYVGPDSFTFTANDGNVDSNTATVSISVEGPLNVSSGIVIERGLFIAAEPLPGNFGLRKQVQFVTLKNKSGVAISGPVYLALDNLNRANLTNASGFTTKAPFGSPYVQVNVGNDNVFSVNEKVTVQLNFTPTSFGTISYNTRVLAGSGTP